MEFIHDYVLRHEHERVPDHGQFEHALLVKLAKALEHLTIRLLHPKWKGLGLRVGESSNGDIVVGIVTKIALWNCKS